MSAADAKTPGGNAGTILRGRLDDEPAHVAFHGGEVVAFSRAAPEKSFNEDGAAVLPYPAGGLLAVVDGMGGQSSGDKAAQLTLEALERRLRDGAEHGERLRNATLDAIEAANRDVLGLGVGAGATLAAILLREGAARIVHVGDAMGLHVGQRGQIKTLTIAHSPTGYAVESGLLDESEALHHEERHLVSNFVGTKSMRLEISGSIPVARRDTLLVASDGLADNLAVDELIAIVRSGPLLDCGRELARLARHRMATLEGPDPSKPDDLTFVLYRRTD